LSSPKPTTTRFYLRPMDGTAPKDGQEDADVDYDLKAEQQLRGRKFYRHQGSQLNSAEYSSVQGKETDQNRTVIGVVEPESTFEFEVAFENLADVELGALLWSIELEGWHHRLGFAKPLGFGSVVIEVQTLQLLNPQSRYETLGSGLSSITEEDAKARKTHFIELFKKAMTERYGGKFEDLDNIRDMKSLLSQAPDCRVHYPRSTQNPQPDGKNYEWFMGNKRKGGPRLALPLAPDDTEGFPLIDKSGELP
ncbi:MAG: TIGR03986 family CRISPR-associated RAMP protein, partial [Anaerolineae bacterium]|nr:TIGR03986 family CRISPR-associated RAMP protein [Anaerolineae bacterium]